MSSSELIAQFEGMPSQEESMFPFAVREVRDRLGAGAEAACLELVEMSDDDIDTNGACDPGTTRFLALYMLLLMNWDGLNFQRYRDLVDRYDGDFPEDRYPYFLTFRSQYYASRGDDLEDLELACDYARAAKERLSQVPAVLHLYAITVLRIGESGEAVSDDQLDEVNKAISNAIRIDRDLFARHEKTTRFARYHATKALLQTYRGRHREARRELHRAFDLEDPNDSGSIAEFLEIRGRIALNEQLGPVRSEVGALSERIEVETANLKDLSTSVADQIRLQAVQLLGLLAAVLAFLFTGTEIARQLNFHDASKLMLVVSGAILVVFGGFSLIFYAEHLTARRIGATVIATCLGGALLAVGLLV
ncbi:MAG TPA: hypothetical protein VIP57_17265 [Candidatus Dormibacteraeota bacterium]